VRRAYPSFAHDEAKLRITIWTLPGGLSSALALVRASFEDRGERRTSVFVVKTLEGYFSVDASASASLFAAPALEATEQATLP
jgi:hypothetical protein